MYISSSLVNNLLDFDPRIRTDEGERFRNPGEPCNGWLGTVNAVALPDEGVRVYVSCREHIASFTSPDGLTFGAADETMVEGGIDPEVHILEDGTFRLFHTVRDPENHPTLKPFNPQELVTAVSEDGIHWKTEGIILMADQTPYSIIADPSTVQLEDGSWRIYYGSKNEQKQVIVSVRWWPDQP
jgi:N-acetyl-beta-hexosaminidase